MLRILGLLFTESHLRVETGLADVRCEKGNTELQGSDGK